MSIGQPCKYCSHGKMRPFHFSLEQAVVLCDNNNCKSLLEVTPLESIIWRDFLQPIHHSSSEFDIHQLLSDGSSSGVYSGSRSSLVSPAQSHTSITDEEVEWLLKASYSPTNSMNLKPAEHHSTPPSQAPLSSTSLLPDLSNCNSTYNGFFELLGNLDLDVPSQSVNNVSQSESSCATTGLDIVTAELESWMKDFESPSTLPDTTLSDPSSGDQKPSNEVTRSDSDMDTTTLEGHSIPSQKLAFSPVPVLRSESVMSCGDNEDSSINLLSDFKLAVGINEMPSENFVQQFENSDNCALLNAECEKESIHSLMDTQFMSPAASAVSDDSGYNEEEGKVSSISGPVLPEDNHRVSSDSSFVCSSLKNQENSSRSKLVTEPSQNNIKSLIAGNLERPALYDAPTYTVLPAMVAADKAIAVSHQESKRSPGQSTNNEELNISPEDERESNALHMEQQVEENTSSRICSPEENNSKILLSDENASVNEGDSNVVSELSHSHSSVIPQPAECILSESSSHSASAPVDVSKDAEDGASHSASPTSEGAPCSSGSTVEEKNRRGRRGRRRGRGRGCSKPFRQREQVKSIRVPDCGQAATSYNLPRGRGRGRCKGYGLKSSRGHIQTCVKKSSPSLEQTKLSKISNEVLTRQTRQRAASLKIQPSATSLGETSSKVAAKEAVQGYSAREQSPVTQNPSWQVPERGNRPHMRRLTNLSLRNLLTGQVSRDPWSVADLYLEELAIEVVVQGVAPSQDVINEASPLDKDEAVVCDTMQQASSNVQIRENSGKLRNEIKEVLSLSTSDSAETLLSKISVEQSSSERGSSDIIICSEEKPSNKEHDKISPLPDKASPAVTSKDTSVCLSSSCDDKKGVQQVDEELIDVHGMESSSDHDQDSIVNTKRMLEASGCPSASLCKLKPETSLHMLNNTQGKTNMEEIGCLSSSPISPKEICYQINEDFKVFQKVAQAETQSVQRVSSHCDNHSSDIVTKVRSEDHERPNLQGSSSDSLRTETEAIKYAISNQGGGNLPVLFKEMNTVMLGNNHEIDLMVDKREVAEKSLDKPNMEQVHRQNGELDLAIGKNICKLPLNMTNSATQQSPSYINIKQCNSEGSKVLDLLNDYINECSGSNTKACDQKLPYLEHETQWEEKLVDDSCLIAGLASNDKIEVESAPPSPSTLPGASPQYLPHSWHTETVRSWMGCKDKTLMHETETSSAEDKVFGSTSPTKQHLNLETSFSSSSSKYYESLLEDMDFDENFFQCPVQEPPSQTFMEHLSSCLFFGETASNSSETDHKETVEIISDITGDSHSESKSQSSPQLHNQLETAKLTSTTNTQMPCVPLQHNLAQVPITSSYVEASPSKLPAIATPTAGEVSPQIKTVHIVSFNAQVKGQSAVPSDYIHNFDSSSTEQIIPEAKKLCSSQANAESKKSISEENLKKASLQKGMCASIGKYIEQDHYIKEECHSGLPDISSVGFEAEGKLANLGHKSKNKSKICSAFAGPSTHDISDWELSVDSSLEPTVQSEKSAVKGARTLSCNSIHLIETPLCCSSDKADKSCTVCDCYSSSIKATDASVSLNVDASCSEESFSGVGHDIGTLPTIGLNSDNEIEITIPRKSIKHDSSLQCEDIPKSGHITTSGKIYETDANVNIPAKLNIITDENVKENLTFGKATGGKLVSANISNKTPKRVVEDEEQPNKKVKLLQGPNTKRRRKKRKENYKSPFVSNSRCGPFTCGILDNSIVHDEQCCSSSLEDFKDFVTQDKSCSKKPDVLKVYSGFNKQHSDKRQKVLGVSSIPVSVVAKKNIDKEEFTCRNTTENISQLFLNTNAVNHEFEFGCTKSSPQHVGYPCSTIDQETSGPGLLELDLPHAEFLSTELSSVESCVSSDPSEEQKGSETFDSHVSCLSEFNSIKLSRSKRKLSEDSELDWSASNDATRQDVSDSTPETSTSNGADDNTKECSVSHKVSGVHRLTILSRDSSLLSVSDRNVKPIVEQVCSVNETLSVNSQRSICNKSASSLNIPKVSKALKKIILIEKSSPQTSSTFSLPVKSVESNKTQCSTGFPSLPTSPCIDTVGSVEAQSSRNQHCKVSHATHSGSTLPVSGIDKNMKVQTLTTTSSTFVCNDTSYASIMRPNIETQPSEINYQVPVSADSLTIIPPALAASHAFNVKGTKGDSSVTLRGCTKTNIISNPVEKMIAVTNNTANGPVTRILRVVSSSSLPVNPSSTLNDANKDTPGNSSNNENAEACDGQSMLKKVKLGSNGSFYLRPTPTLKNAILEMRKKKCEEGEEKNEGNSSGYLTLPDGNPISHPIFIPPRKTQEPEPQISKKRKKRKNNENERKMRALVEKKIMQTLECSVKNDDVPKMIAVYVGGKFHICHIDLA